MASVKLIFLLTLATIVTSAPTAHVIVAIGQSNSVGSNSDGHTDEDVSYDNIIQTSCCINGTAVNDNCQLIVGQDPLHHECSSGFLNGQSVGFGMSFARQFRLDIPADDILILVPAGIGGTGFVDNVWPAYTGTGFKIAVARIKSTFQIVAQKYPNHLAVLDGYLWHQGETDADASTTTLDYLYKDIIPMINAWRNTTLISQTNEKVPFVVGNMVPGWVQEPDQTKRLGVSAALQILDQVVPYSMAVPSQGLAADPNSSIHFSAKSQRVFGKRYYAGWKGALLNSSV